MIKGLSTCKDQTTFPFLLLYQTQIKLFFWKRKSFEELGSSHIPLPMTNIFQLTFFKGAQSCSLVNKALNNVRVKACSANPSENNHFKMTCIPWVLPVFSTKCVHYVLSTNTYWVCSVFNIDFDIFDYIMAIYIKLAYDINKNTFL